jgi:Cdc6-like AAA superfamily ATPase
VEHIDVGNARQALDLLRVGAEVAEKAGDDCVTETHITEARTKVQRGRLENRIRDQIQHAQYFTKPLS